MPEKIQFEFPEVQEILLPQAPLIVVLAQIRFEPILSIENQASLAPFQDAIREEYPLLRREQSETTQFNPAKDEINVSTRIIWRFSDLDEKWKVSLARSFISMETSEYTSRDEFLHRFEKVLNALTTHFKPGVVRRTGIRYIDRLTGDALGQLPAFVKPELLGLLGDAQLESAVNATATEAIINLGPNRLLARWGRLPAKSTIDPVLVKPLDAPSWILDIDASRSAKKSWEQAAILKEFQEQSDICYRFFRWAVTDKFLVHFGAKL